MRSSRLLALPALTALALAAACGTTAPAAGDDPTTAAGGDAAAPVSVEDDRGTAVELEAPAQDVVALEWNLVEDLVALGVMPVGVADVEGYSTWNTAAPLDPGVVDVGTRGEPSVDAIIGTDADLVVTTADLAETVIAQIEDAGLPVLVVDGSDATDPLGQMESTLELLATATGTEEQADELLAGFDAAIADGRAALEEAGVAGASFVMADGWQDGGTVSVRMFTSGAWLTVLGTELGLVNAWEGEGDPAYGLQNTDVEGLTQLDGDVHFLYIVNEAFGDPFVDGLTGNAVWESLPFVQAGTVHRLPDGIWMFGGPLSGEQFIDATVAALTE